MEEPSAREKILQAAEEVFVDRGLAGARVATIAERAGVNKAMLYYYFKSKEGLFQAVLDQNAAAIFGLADGILEDSESLIEDRLESFVLSYSNLIRSKPNFVKLIVWDLLSGGEHFTAALAPQLPRLMLPFAKLFQEGQAAGRFSKDLNPLLLMPSIVAPYLLFSLGSATETSPISLLTKMQNMTDTDEIWDEYTKTAMTLLMRGVLATPSCSGE